MYKRVDLISLARWLQCMLQPQATTMLDFWLCLFGCGISLRCKLEIELYINIPDMTNILQSFISKNMPICLRNVKTASIFFITPTIIGRLSSLNHKPLRDV